MRVSDTLVDIGDGLVLETRRICHGQRSGGPVLVFLHESLGNIALWRSFPEQLAAETGLDALVYARTGYGRSSDEPLPRPRDYMEREGAVVLPRLLDVLGIDRAVLVGHSDGGSIALIGAGAMGSRVQGLVTMAAHIYADHLTIAGIRDMAERYRSTDIRTRLQRYHGDRTDALFQAWQTIWLDKGFHQAMDFSRWLADISCPAMIIQGEADEYGVPEQVTDIVSGIGSGACGVFLPDTGHSPHLENPDRVRQLVCDFLLGPGDQKKRN